MKYNHAFDIAFQLVSAHDGENVTGAELRQALLARIAELDAAGEESFVEACGMPFDSFEIEGEHGGEQVEVAP